MARTSKNRIVLPNGCTATQIVVHPSNYKDGATTTTRWYLKYRFYDPRYKQPKQVFLRGMNDLSDIKARIARTEWLIMQEMQKLLEGHNPFEPSPIQPTKTLDRKGFTVPVRKYPIHDDDSWENAFLKAIPYLKKSAALTDNVITHVTQTLSSVRILGMDEYPIGKVKAKEMMLVFDHLAESVPHWSNHLHNRYRSHLGYIFAVLKVQEANFHDPHKMVPRQVVPKRFARVLETQEIQQIFDYAKEHHYHFYRFLYIFYHSGARPVELLRLRFEDVEFKQLVFKVRVHKGNQDVEEWKAIHQNTLPVWSELYNMARPGDYIFGEDFLPGKFWNKVKPYEAPYRRIKNALKITKKMYSLKHHRLDAIEEYMYNDQGIELAMEVAKNFASHRSKNTGANYASGRKARMLALLRRIPSEI